MEAAQPPMNATATRTGLGLAVICAPSVTLGQIAIHVRKRLISLSFTHLSQLFAARDARTARALSLVSAFVMLSRMASSATSAMLAILGTTVAHVCFVVLLLFKLTDL
jgi:hypothetical protein